MHVYGNGTTALGANQINQHAYERKALIDAVQESYFGQLADVKNMPWFRAFKTRWIQGNSDYLLAISKRQSWAKTYML